MLQRTLSLLHKNCGGVCPVGSTQAAPEDLPLRVVARCVCVGGGGGGQRGAAVDDGAVEGRPPPQPANPSGRWRAVH